MKGTLVKFPHSPILHYAFSSLYHPGKISAQPHTTLCIQFSTRENNKKKNNIIPLGEQICFDNSMGLYGNFTGSCAETLPVPFPSTAL